MNLYWYVNMKFRPVHDTRTVRFETLVRLRYNRRSFRDTSNVRVNYENVVINYFVSHFILNITFRHMVFFVLCDHIL